MEIKKIVFLTELFLAAMITVTLLSKTDTVALSAQDDFNGPMAEFDSFLDGSSDTTSNERNEPGVEERGPEFPDGSSPINDAYEKFQGCLSSLEGRLKAPVPTEQQVQECFDSSYNANENDNTRETGSALR